MSDQNATLICGINSVNHVLAYNPLNINEILYDAKRNRTDLKAILSLAAKNGIPSHPMHFERNKALANTVNQGIAARLKSIYCPYDTVQGKIRAQDKSLILILDRIQDPHNLGACLRSACAAGVDAVILSKHDSCAITPAVTKVACGAVGVLPIIQVSNIKQILQKLKDDQYWVYATDSEATSPLESIEVSLKSAIVIGSEHHGVKPIIRDNADFLLKINNQGSIKSLNASVAAGHIVLTFASKMAQL